MMGYIKDMPKPAELQVLSFLTIVIVVIVVVLIVVIIVMRYNGKSSWREFLQLEDLGISQKGGLPFLGVPVNEDYSIWGSIFNPKP